MRLFNKLFIVPVMLTATMAFGQVKPSDTLAKELLKKVAAKIDSTPVKSSLSYEQLTQFFQTTVASGANGGFDFKSSWFGVKRLFSGDKNLDLSRYYSDNKFARNFELALGVHKNKNGDLSTLLAGIKYSPINNRSKSDVNFYTDPKVKAAVLKVHDLFTQAAGIYQRDVLDKLSVTESQAKVQKLQTALKKFNTPEGVYKDLPADLIPILHSLLKADHQGESLEEFGKISRQTTDSLAKSIDRRSLLTLSLNPGYDYNHKYFDTTGLTVSYVVGLGKDNNKPFNLNVKVQGLLAHDTLGSKNNLARHKFIGLVGINKILANDAKLNPVIEFELQAEDDYVSSTLYKDEQRHLLTMNTVLRVHLSKQVSLPITIKYDLKKPNLFGIFQLQWNLESAKSD